MHVHNKIKVEVKSLFFAIVLSLYTILPTSLMLTKPLSRRLDRCGNRGCQ